MGSITRGPPPAVIGKRRHKAHRLGVACRCLTFEPSLDDLPDVLEVAPYSDLVYATGKDGAVLAEVS